MTDDTASRRAEARARRRRIDLECLREGVHVAHSHGILGRLWCSGQQPPDGTVVAEVTEGTRTIQKVWREGRIVCMCPFLCMATYERCAFDVATGTGDRG